MSHTLDSIGENIACFINSSKSEIEVLTSSYETIVQPQKKKRKFMQQIYEQERLLD